MNLPNLAGVASKDLVEKIGSGKFSAAYINWSRTMNLLRQHAPGWLVDYELTEQGYDQPKQLLHRAPVGGYLMIRFKHVDGSVTPAVPQAVMDHRNQAIPYDKITARDITDTQRRGMCMAAAMHFGLAYELWAKMPMESGYAAPDAAPEAAPKPAPTAPKAAAVVAKESEVTEATFRETCLECGLTTHACDGLIGVINGDFAKGITTLKKKSPAEVEGLNAKFAPATEEDGEW